MGGCVHLLACLSWEATLPLCRGPWWARSNINPLTATKEGIGLGLNWENSSINYSNQKSGDQFLVFSWIKAKLPMPIWFSFCLLTGSLRTVTPRQRDRAKRWRKCQHFSRLIVTPGCDWLKPCGLPRTDCFLCGLPQTDCLFYFILFFSLSSFQLGWYHFHLEALFKTTEKRCWGMSLGGK